VQHTFHAFLIQSQVSLHFSVTKHSTFSIYFPFFLSLSSSEDRHSAVFLKNRSNSLTEVYSAAVSGATEEI
jgi:hypothetical protein